MTIVPLPCHCCIHLVTSEEALRCSYCKARVCKACAKIAACCKQARAEIDLSTNDGSTQQLIAWNKTLPQNISEGYWFDLQIVSGDLLKESIHIGVLMSCVYPGFQDFIITGYIHHFVTNNVVRCVLKKDIRKYPDYVPGHVITMNRGEAL